MSIFRTFNLVDSLELLNIHGLYGAINSILHPLGLLLAWANTMHQCYLNSDPEYFIQKIS